MKKCKRCGNGVEKTSDMDKCPDCVLFAKKLKGAKLFDMVEELAAALDMSLILGDSILEETKKEYEELKERAWNLLREIEK